MVLARRARRGARRSSARRPKRSRRWAARPPRDSSPIAGERAGRSRHDRSAGGRRRSARHRRAVRLSGAAQGGGGRRREGHARRARQRREVESALETARREAKNAFGDDAVYVEKYIVGPRHVEIQVLGDQHGTMLSLNERECSVQRRHQKMIEEAPSVAVTPELRRAMGETAVRAASAAGYVNAGTCEFLLDRDGKFYFLEMNTRLQVEHPVTELVTGIDLVQWQIRVAAGEKLPFRQEDIVPRGWAIECRITSEDPANGFLPSTGRISYLHLPSGPGVRWDGGIEVGSEVGLFYDPMLAKLIVHAPTREAAVERMHRALLELTIEGVESSRDFHLRVMEDAEFRAGAIEIQWLERRLESLTSVEAAGEDGANGGGRRRAHRRSRPTGAEARSDCAEGAAPASDAMDARGATGRAAMSVRRGDDRLDRGGRRRHRSRRRRRRLRAAHGAGRSRRVSTRHAKAIRARHSRDAADAVAGARRSALLSLPRGQMRRLPDAASPLRRADRGEAAHHSRRDDAHRQARRRAPRDRAQRQEWRYRRKLTLAMRSAARTARG